MKKYESVFLLKDTTRDEYKKILNKVLKEIEKIITIDTIEELGIRKLAYEIRKNKQAYYIIIKFKATDEDVTELQRIYRIIDDVLKFIIVNIDD